MPNSLTLADLAQTGTLITIDGGYQVVEHAQNEGPASGTLGNEKSNAKRVFFCLWPQMNAVCKVLLGGPSVALSGSTKYISRQIPHEHAAFLTPTGGYFLYAQTIDWAGFRVLGKGTVAPSMGDYNFAKLTVHYENLPYKILRDGAVTTRNSGTPDESGWERYITKIVKPQGEFFTVRPGTAAGNGYTYVGGGSIMVAQGVPKLIVPYNLQITWHQIPESGVPCRLLNTAMTAKGAIDYALGRVNDAAWLNYAKGALLLMGVEMRPYNSAFGDRIYDITYLFKYFEPQDAKTHQFIYKSDSPLGPGWIEITTDGSTNISNVYINKSVYDWFPGGGTAGTSDTTSTKGTAWADLFRPPA